MTNINGQYNSGGMGAFNQYQSQQYGAQMRDYQQQMIRGQDQQVAAQSLREAQARYSYVSGYGGGSYYGGASIGYGGAGYAYGGNYGFPTTPTPALDPSRQ